MSFVGSIGSLPSSVSGGAANIGTTTGRVRNASYGMHYPSPFFDVAHTWLPTTVKSMFKMCRYFFFTQPLINATVFKLSEYAVTDVIVEHESRKVVNLWTEYLHDHLRIRPFQIESGLDYNVYGNSLAAVRYPLQKYLTCTQCGFGDREDRVRKNYIYTGGKFRFTCPKCEHVGPADVKEIYIKSAGGIKLIRWNPEDIDIEYNDISGQRDYYYNIPDRIKSDIQMGKKGTVGTIPQLFLSAVNKKRSVVFSPEKLYHMHRPTLAGKDCGWGTPLLLPVLKDAYYLQVMKKAQEAVLLEHILPLRVLFPQAASGSTDPFTTINLSTWQEHIAKEIARWRMDPNYIPILPLPIGQQTLGGDGRALLLTGEMQQWSEQIVAGMGVPREFVFGGMSYSGTNVSMRMVENAFLSYIMHQLMMVRWIVREIATFLDWPLPKIRFKPFKMADDLQRKAFLAQLNEANKLSDTSLLAECDYDQHEENQIMLRETASRLEATKEQQLAMAKIQAEQQVIMSKAQAKSQQVMMEAQQAPIAPGEPGGPETQMAGAAPGSVGSGMAEPGQPAPPAAQMPAGPQQALPPQGPPQPGQSPMDEMGSQVGMNAQPQPGTANVDPTQLAQFISQMSPGEQQSALQNIKNQSPELGQMVEQIIANMRRQQGGEGAVDMRPMPEQRPPRRENSPV